jgi:YidC/Oxa1 family membrane protein insertase
MRKEFRFFLWLLLSTATLVGLVFLRNWISPQPEKPAESKPRDIQAAKEQAPALAAAFAAASPGGWALPGDAWSPKAVEAQVKATQEASRLKQAEAARNALAAVPDKSVTLGAADGSKLLVTLSQRGGAVKTITLKDHEAASVDKAKPLGHSLVLVNDDDDGKLQTLDPADQLARQSFRFLVKDAVIEWTIKEETPNKVVFEGRVPGHGVTVTRTFSLEPGAYHLDHQLSLAFDPRAKTAGQKEFVYELTGPYGLPIEGIAWKRSPFRQAVVTTVDAKSGGAKRKLFDPSQLRENSDELVRPADEGRELQYAGVMVQYFAALVVVDGDPAQARWLQTIKPEYLGDDADFPKGAEAAQGKVGVRLVSRPIPIEPGNTVTHQYLLFAGPVKVRLLNYEPGVPEGLPDRYEKELHINLLTDAPSDNWFSRMMAHLLWNDLLVIFTNVMHWLLEHLVYVTRHYGVAIILLTLLVRLCMFPISRKQALASIRMQKLAPELKKLQEKHKDDRQALAQAQMRLYREQGVNPMSGCLIILLQMPVFMGLYYALNESFHLRLASFLWIDNLAVPDDLFGWSSWPGIGDFARWINLGPTFNLLPLISVALMIVQQKYLTPPPADEQQAAQMKMMNIMMIFMAYMFYWVAAGLCVYFVVSGAWGILERKLLPKITHEKAKPAAEGKGAVPARGRGKPSPNGDRNSAPGFLGKIADWCHEIIKRAEKK